MARNVLQRGLGFAALAWLASACGNVLGIEELTAGPRPGVGGAGGGDNGSASGGDASLGGSGASNAAGNGGGSGSDLAAAGSGGAPVVTPEADAGAPDAGSNGPFVVAGRVIDFLRRPVPDVPVTIGGATAVTNAQGEFRIEAVSAPYTASLMITGVRNNSPARYGYVYEGLTRDDPTLQVYSALAQRSASSLSVTYQDIVFEDDLHYVMLAWSTPDGQLAIEEATGPVQYLGVPSWSGPATTTGTIHALDAFKDVASDPPVAYQAYQSQTLSVSDNQPATVGFSLPFDPNLSTGGISGSATGGINERSNYVSVRFSDGTAMPLIDQSATGEAFSYFVPNLPGASLIVAAADGISARPPYAVAHREIPAITAEPIALSIPRAVSLTSPQVDAPVTPATPFAWSPLSQTATTFLWHLEFVDTFQGMFVLTERTQIELPEFADGFTVPPGVGVTWAVETHGDAPNADAFAGRDGYLDAFAFGDSYPRGPNRSDGYYTESERRFFTMGGAALTPQ